MFYYLRLIKNPSPEEKGLKVLAGKQKLSG